MAGAFKVTVFFIETFSPLFTDPICVEAADFSSSTLRNFSDEQGVTSQHNKRIGNVVFCSNGNIYIRNSNIIFNIKYLSEITVNPLPKGIGW